MLFRRIEGSSRGIAAVGCAVAVLTWSTSAFSQSVTYESYDLSDAVVGEDLWSMSYQLTGPVGAFGSWNLLYGADLYRGLSVTGNDAPGVLSALVSEPVPALGADGQLTVTALEAVDGSFRAGVSVSFTWLGVGQPGSQAYQVLDESFNVVGAGDSLLAVAAPVPEPTSLTMGLLGGALLALRRRRSLPD